jgi:uncharacterized membrane protein YphA (DoxX/SURF4 family)
VFLSFVLEEAVMTYHAVANRLVPLILRVALAVIFIYHGVTKITGTNTHWGSNWAETYWKSQGLPPDDWAAKVHSYINGIQKAKDTYVSSQTKGDKIKEAAGKADPQLKEGAANKEEETGTEAWFNKKLEGVHQAEEVIHHVYAKESPDMPEVVQMYWAQLAVSWGELLGGLALLFGWGTRLAAVGLIIIQVGAIVTVTSAKGFSAVEGGGYEFNIALVAMCLALLVQGGGWYSLDHVFHGPRTQKTS